MKWKSSIYSKILQLLSGKHMIAPYQKVDKCCLDNV